MNKSLATSGEEITGRPGLLGRVRWRSLAIVLPFLVIFIAVSIGSPSFLKPVNLLNILDQQSSILIIAAAGTIVLITGGIDLSVGATYALSSVVAGTLAMTQGPIVAILAGLAVGALVGLVNGVVSTILKINALIATLAMSFIALGVASLVTGGNLIVLYDHPDFGVIAKAKILGVQSAIWIAIIVVVVLGLILARTTLGRYWYAAGGNAEAARLAGIQVSWVRILAFVLSGVAAGLGGILDTSRVLSAQASAGTALTFTVLAGIVVGGTSILGGEGAIWRTVIGVLFIALIGNGFNLLGVDALFQQITLGLILLIAVGIDAWSRVRR
ncbi:MAG: ABC transporter permease [Microbacteriaceae bacterium]|jgi:ribose transport system permease protein